MRITFFAATAALLSLAACDKAPAPAPGVAVTEAWARLPAVQGRPGAAYFTIENNGPAARLVGVTSPDAQRIELHDSREEGGIMRMEPLHDLAIPANGSLSFEPGGKHAMLFDIAPKIQRGGTIRLTFTFDSAPTATIEASVVAAGDDPAHQGH